MTVKTTEEHIGRTCPYCQAVIKPQDDVVKCGRCDVAHHKECWDGNDGCTTLGCQEKRGETGPRLNLPASTPRIQEGRNPSLLRNPPPLPERSGVWKALLLFLFSVPLAAPALMIGDCNDGTVIRQLLWLYLLGWCLLICIAALCVLSSKELRQAVNVAWRRVLIGLVVLDIFVGGMAWLIYDLQRGSKWICVGVSHRQRFTSQSRYVNRDSRRNDQLVIGAGNTGLLRDEWTGIWLGKRSEEGQEVRVIRYGGSERVSPSSLVPITLDHLKEKHQAFFSLVSRVRLRRDSGMIDFPWGPESLEAALKRPLGDDWVIVTYEGLGFIGDR